MKTSITINQAGRISIFLFCILSCLCKFAPANAMSIATGSMAACQAGFSYVVNGQTVTFTNTSTGTSSNTNYFWNFGDNVYSSVQNPVHTYQYGGTYTVCLNIYDSLMACSDTFCSNITIVGPPLPCQAFFYCNSSNNVATFYSTSTNVTPNTQYSWTFGDNTSGTGPNPTHTYANGGSHFVCLYISDNSIQCSNSFCNSVMINGPFTSSCTAAFTSTVNGSTAIFTNTSTSTTNTTTYRWDFGDNTLAYTQNAQHTYQYGNTYNVCLTLLDSLQSCSSTVCQNVTVSGPPGPCNAYYIIYPDSSTPFNYIAINYSTGTNPMSYIWNWGDNTPNSTVPYPTHAYIQPGIYQVCLSIADANGCTSAYCTSLQVFRLSASAVSVPVTINVMAPTGIAEQQQSSMDIYPNPASEILYVKEQNHNAVSYKIYDLLGNEISYGNITNNAMPVNDLLKGIYIIRINLREGSFFTRQFIKN